MNRTGGFGRAGGGGPPVAPPFFLGQARGPPGGAPRLDGNRLPGPVETSLDARARYDDGSGLPMFVRKENDDVPGGRLRHRGAGGRQKEDGNKKEEESTAPPGCRSREAATHSESWGGRFPHLHGEACSPDADGGRRGFEADFPGRHFPDDAREVRHGPAGDARQQVERSLFGGEEES